MRIKNECSVVKDSDSPRAGGAGGSLSSMIEEIKIAVEEE
jgi:hypothetical protein